MAIRHLTTRGYGNGTFNGTIGLVTQRGYGLNVSIAYIGSTSQVANGGSEHFSSIGPKPDTGTVSGLKVSVFFDGPGAGTDWYVFGASVSSAYRGVIDWFSSNLAATGTSFEDLRLAWRARFDGTESANDKAHFKTNSTVVGPLGPLGFDVTIPDFVFPTYAPIVPEVITVTVDYGAGAEPDVTGIIAQANGIGPTYPMVAGSFTIGAANTSAELMATVLPNAHLLHATLSRGTKLDATLPTGRTLHGTTPR